MKPLLNRLYHLSGWHPYEWHLCWITDIISLSGWHPYEWLLCWIFDDIYWDDIPMNDFPMNEFPMNDTPVKSLMSSLGMKSYVSGWHPCWMTSLLNDIPVDDIPPDKHLVEFRVPCFLFYIIIIHPLFIFMRPLLLYFFLSSLNTEDIRVPLLYI